MSAKNDLNDFRAAVKCEPVYFVNHKSLLHCKPSCLKGKEIPLFLEI